MQDWETYKRAALDYSKMKPRLRAATITLVAAATEQTLPADCLWVKSLAYGSQGSLLEVLDETTGAQVWSDEGGQLVISPAPTEDTTVRIIYYATHQPNEDTQAFPTIPAADLPYVDDLEQAHLLDMEADQVAGGPVTYSFGQTQVDRSASMEDLRMRALRLRTSVELALGEPLGSWS